jgi:hypothetical protein
MLRASVGIAHSSGAAPTVLVKAPTARRNHWRALPVELGASAQVIGDLGAQLGWLEHLGI